MTLQDPLPRCAHGELALRVLASADYHPVPYRARHAALAERLGLDFGSILFLLDHVPICLDGPAHARKRAEVARLMAERREAVAAALPGIVERHCAVLARPGDLDMMGGCLDPLVDALISALIGMKTGLAPGSLVSRVFSQTMGIAQRRQMEAELAGLAQRLGAAFPVEDADRHGSRMALAVLGRDALIGTLSLSLHDHFATLAGAPLRSWPMPVVPTRTGVPYIDRQARAEVELAGEAVPAGGVVRCRLNSLEGAEDDSRMRFFGAGAHVCLGRAVTLDLFAALSRHLSGLATSVRTTAFDLRKDDVFAIPSHFTVRIS